LALFFASSDARQRYAEDVLTVVATPAGGHFQSRYESRYVATDVHALVAKGEIVGKPAVVAFAGRVGTSDAFVIPIRMATVTSAEVIADAVVFTFGADGFPDLSSWPRDNLAMETYGKGVLGQMILRYSEYFPVMAQHDGLVVNSAGSGTSQWNQVTGRLAKLETFSNSYFARISIGAPPSGGRTPKFQDGCLVVRGGSPFVLKCWFYRADNIQDSRRVALSCDGSILTTFSDASYSISSRYDDVEFWVSPRGVSIDQRTLVQVSIPGASAATSDLPTRVRIPTIVESPMAPKAGRAVVGGIAAALVSSPAILGPESALALRLAWR
jgi:hypothetical protein